MLSYSEYVNNSDKINIMLKNLEEEFSKYINLRNLENGELKTEWTSYPDKIFLLDDDFGFILVPNKMGGYYSDIGISVYSAYKVGKKFTYSNFGSANTQVDLYYSPKDNIEEFVKHVIAKMKTRNEIRIKNKEKRELIKTTNKYNIWSI